MTGIGHNSGDDTFAVSDDDLAKADAEATDKQLLLFFERIERLEEEKKAIGDDVKDTFAEAKAQGYDTKIMRRILALRKMAPHDRAEMEALLETYKAAIGLA